MQKRFRIHRLPFTLALVLLLGSIPVDGLVVARASAGTTAPTETASSWSVAGLVYNTAATKKKKRRKRRRSRRKRYTLRGNPEVTRKVATELIVEKLPELAELAGLDVPAAGNEGTAPTDQANAAESEAPVTGSDAPEHEPGSRAAIPTTGVNASIAEAPGYSDSEFSDEDDPDQLTEDDDEMLADEDELTIVEFYDEFTQYMKSLNGDTYITDNGIDKVVAMETLMEWLGTRYLFGGTTSRGIDCSAFTRTMYKSLGCQLPRTAAAQWEVGDEVDYDNLQFGDLIFFHTRKAVYVSHVGMYLGNGMFAHASSRNGVTVSSLESNYYSTHFIGGRRYNIEAPTADPETVASSVQTSDSTQVQ